MPSALTGRAASSDATRRIGCFIVVQFASTSRRQDILVGYRINLFVDEMRFFVLW